MPATPDEEARTFPRTHTPGEGTALDPRVIKVLASDTRRDLLHYLDERRMTLSELARRSGLKKATVLEHLRRLVDAGLIRRLDDGQRLWIYYELTRDGQNVVNPGRRRLFYILATAATAVAAGILLLAALAPGLFQLSAPSHDTLAAEAATTSAWAGRASVDTRFANANGPVSAWLVPADRLDLLAAGGEASGAPARVDGDGQGGFRVVAASAVPSGTYALYLRDADGRDNADAMPRLHLHDLHASLSTPVHWRGLGGDVQVGLGGGPRPANGLLSVALPAGALAVPVVNGTALLPAAGLDLAPEGRHALRFLPDRGEWVDVPAALVVRAPRLGLVPSVIPEGRPATVELILDEPLRGGAVPPILVDGQPANLSMHASSLHIHLPGLVPGDVEVRVGRLSSTTLHVARDLALGFRAEPNATTIHLTSLGLPVGGVAAFLDGQALGVSDGNGTLRADLPEGEHELRLVTADGAYSTRPVLVAERNVSEAPARLRLTTAATSAPGEARVAAAVANDGVAAERVALLTYRDGTLAHVRAVRVEPGANLSVHVAVPAAGNVSIRVSALDLDGNATVENVMALAVPSLPAPKPAEVPSPFVPIAPAARLEEHRGIPLPALGALAALAAARALRRR